jgi:class 3 adenylate cyclase/DNA-binding winged helix-turn-helix (wHTH) protein/tetratricopeptide (TPR) repeat protein
VNELLGAVRVSGVEQWEWRMLYVFDDSELDTQRYTLRRSGQTSRLHPKAYQVLLHLIEHRDRVVSKQELADKVWPEQFIADATLQNTIRTIRRALDDSGRAQRIIQTMRRRGYRFIAHLTGSFTTRADAAQDHKRVLGRPEDLDPVAPEFPAPPASLDSEVWQCRFCRHINLVDPFQETRFCIECGTPFQAGCPGCGRQNPSQAKFCATCGAALSQLASDLASCQTDAQSDRQRGPRPQTDPALSGLAMPESERRQLTVMFCDLVNSTHLSSQLDLEDYRDVIRAYQATCAEVIQRFDGHVAQYLGDGLLVYFGYPLAHEDDAQRAVHTGLGILERFGDLSARVRRDQGVELAMRMGIHTGQVIVSQIGHGDRQETLALGETLNVAARIQGLARPGTVVISAATERLVHGYFVCQDLGSHDLKGVTDPAPLFGVQGTTGAQNRLEAADRSGLTPFVGRDAEVTMLWQRWEQVKEGLGHVVMLRGEAGIGKSRLVQNLKARLSEASVTILECRCSAYHQQSALYPVIDLCHRILRWRPEDTPEEKWRKLETALGQFSLPMPETLSLFADLLSLPDKHDRYPVLHLTPQQQRQKTLEVILAIMVALSSRQPVLFVVEDLHWIDPSSLELLTHLIEQTPGTRIYTVLACRETFQATWGNRSYLTPITLTRLPRHQVEQIVMRVTGGKPLPPEVLEQIIEKTDGVPLFVEEVTKAVMETGLLREMADQYELTGPLSTSTIPTTLHDSLMARLDRLDTAKSLAQLGAVLGRQFTYGLLQAVAQLHEVQLQQELARLVEAGMVLQKGRPPQATYTFRHALIQETAYQSLVRDTRQHYHQRIAHILTTQFPDRVEAESELLAYHYTEANLIEEAIPYWQRAGQRAVERSANAEAISHFAKGLELLKTLPDTSERAQHELTLQLALGAPLMVVKGYSAPEVERVYTRSRALCEHIGDSPQRLSMLSGLRRFHINRAEFAIARELGEEYLQLAQRLQDPAAMLVANLGQGVTVFHLGEFRLALTYLEQAVAHHDPQQYRSYVFDPMVLSHSYAAWTLWFLGYPDQALKKSQEVITLAQQAPQAHILGSALHFAATVHKWRREPQLTQARSEALIALAREHGFNRWVYGGMTRRGWALAEQGKTEEGIEQLHEGLTSWREGTEMGLPHHLAMLAEAHHRGGEPDKGLRVLAEALSAAYNSKERYYEAELHRLRGELLWGESQRQQTMDARQTLRDVEGCFLQALDVARHQQAKSLELRVAISLARLWQHQDKHLEARQILAEIYGWFSEGFDTPDLQEAKSLLDAL